MRNDAYRLAVAVAAFVGGLSLFVAGFVIALEVRSVVATPSSAPAAQLPNPGHNYDQVALPEGTWPNLDADKLDGYDSSDFGGGGGAVLTTWGYASFGGETEAGKNAPSCPLGWTQAYAGWLWITEAGTSYFCSGTWSIASPETESGITFIVGYSELNGKVAKARHGDVSPHTGTVTCRVCVK